MKKVFFFFLISLIFLYACNKKDEEVDSPNHSPKITLVTPQEGSYYYLNDSVEISVEATDSDGSVSKVRFYLDKTLIYTDTEAPFSYLFIAHKLGLQHFEIYAVDNEEALSQKSYSIVDIRSVPYPNVYFKTYPYSVEVDEELLLEAEIYNYYGSITDCSLLINDTLIETIYSPPYQFRWSSSITGTYYAQLKATNSLGGIGSTDSRDFRVYNNRSPSISIHSPNTNLNPIIPGEEVNIHMTSGDLDHDDYHIDLFVDNEFIADAGMEDNYTWSGTSIPGTHFLHAIATDEHNNKGYSDTIPFIVLKGIPVEETILDLEASNLNNLIYGIYDNSNTLLLIHPNDLSYETLDLPFSNPIRMKYSSSNQKLILQYANLKTISIYNEINGQFSTINVNTTYEITDIDIDNINQFVYIAASPKIFVYDINTLEFQFSMSNFEGEDFEVNPLNQRIYSTIAGYPASLHHYKIENNQLSLYQQFDDIGNQVLRLSLHPNNRYLLAESRWSQEIKMYDAENLNNIVDQTDFNSFRSFVDFSTEGEYITIFPYDTEFQLYETNGFDYIESQYLPNTDNCTDFVSFNNDQELAVFTYNEYHSKAKVIYLFSLNRIKN